MSAIRNILSNFQGSLSSEKVTRGPWTVGSFRNVFSLKFLFGWPPSDSARETAWLDGLRGVAAFLVMSYHFNLQWYFPAGFEAPYGAKSDAMFEFWRLPFLRLWMCSGHTQVSIFFVLSGFVLSWSPLNYIRAGRSDKLAQNLGSATFRRWLRLYLPCFAVAAWEMTEVYLGLRGMPGKESMPTIFHQFWDYLKDCNSFANPFLVDRGPYNSLHGYDWTMWTIPYEFSGSLAVFLVVLGTSRIRSYPRRTLAIAIMSFYACFQAQWSYWLFITGILVGDYVKQHGGFQQLSRSLTPAQRVRWWIVFIIGLFLGGTPEPNEGYSRPGYDWQVALTPKNWMPVEGGGRFWWCWAGILIIFSASHLISIRNIFDRPLARYLGRISFMLYLTHRIVLNLLGTPFQRFIFPIFGRALFIDEPKAPGIIHPLVTFALYLIMWVVVGGTAIITANWFEIIVDAPSTKFARWVEEKFNGGNPPTSSTTHTVSAADAAQNPIESASLLPVTELPPRPIEENR